MKRRRLLWGWAVVDEGSLGLLRELRYDERLDPSVGGGQLLKAPVEELEQLRVQPALVPLSTQRFAVGGHLWLGDQLLAGGRGNQSELTLSFRRPEVAMVLGVDVMAGAAAVDVQASAGDGTNASQRIYIAYVPGASAVRVGVASSLQNITAWMNHTRFTVAGHNLPDPPMHLVQTVAQCAERCRTSSHQHCAAWSVNHTASAPYACDLFGSMGWDVRSDPTTENFTSGLACSSAAADRTCALPGGGGQSDTLQLLESDRTLDIRVFTDNTILEVYWQGGRVAMTLGLDGRGTERTGMDAFAFASSSLNDGAGGFQQQQQQLDPPQMVRVSAQVYQMKSIWTTPDAVLSQAALKSDDARAVTSTVFSPTESGYACLYHAAVSCGWARLKSDDGATPDLVIDASNLGRAAEHRAAGVLDGMGCYPGDSPYPDSVPRALLAPLHFHGYRGCGVASWPSTPDFYPRLHALGFGEVQMLLMGLWPGSVWNAGVFPGQPEGNWTMWDALVRQAVAANTGRSERVTFEIWNEPCSLINATTGVCSGQFWPRPVEQWLTMWNHTYHLLRALLPPTGRIIGPSLSTGFGTRAPGLMNPHITIIRPHDQSWCIAHTVL